MTDTGANLGGWAAPTDQPDDNTFAQSAPPATTGEAADAGPVSVPGTPGAAATTSAVPSPNGAPRFSAADDAYARFKPGIITLRPLSFGQLLDGGIKGIRHNPKVMLGVNALITLLSMIALFGFGAEYFSSAFNFDAAAAAEFDASAITGYVLGALLSAFIATMVTVVTSVSVGRSVMGEVISVKEAWSLSIRRLPAVVLITVLMSLAGTIAIAAVVAIAALVSVFSQGLGIALGVLLGLGLAVALVWAGIKLSLTLPVSVLERLGPIKSMKRSWTLTKGSFWIIFAVLLVASIITSVIQQVISAPVVVFLPLMILSGNEPSSLVFQLLLAGASALGAYVSYVYIASVTAIVYINQRMRREGFDLTLARAVEQRQANHFAATR